MRVSPFSSVITIIEPVPHTAIAAGAPCENANSARCTSDVSVSLSGSIQPRAKARAADGGAGPSSDGSPTTTRAACPSSARVSRFSTPSRFSFARPAPICPAFSPPPTAVASTVPSVRAATAFVLVPPPSTPMR